ncbi:hypothetical protein AX774_g4302 [Zancudomyces culisetae]|uniref:Uncharacterized protein n=1 Tax=Zancudomyces culisetae TaxID=1213189 RepID=A0A1R1PMM8_ZANCU|nr:hypothetical protein AX774_g4302 [Zancudomyces culisetae]|eukprot:OMH82221.1 hypothetical protein AX774_g4302 [Zancudomyces culisetae]
MATLHQLVHQCPVGLSIHLIDSFHHFCRPCSLAHRRLQPSTLHLHSTLLHHTNILACQQYLLTIRLQKLWNRLCLQPKTYHLHSRRSLHPRRPIIYNYHLLPSPRRHRHRLHRPFVPHPLRTRLHHKLLISISCRHFAIPQPSLQHLNKRLACTLL